MYTVVGATGNIGSVITRKLLEKGEKVRVVGRNACRLEQFVRKGAEAIVADVKDTEALTKALTGARAAFLMMPPGLTSPDYRAEQETESNAIATAAKNSGLQYAVNLSSIGAHAPAGTGPILGLHDGERKLNAVERLNVLHLRPAYFMENHLSAIEMIQMMGIFAGALRPELKMPMIATRDVGARAAERLLNLDFSGKQTEELLGERDLSMTEVAATISRAIGKPDLRYLQFTYGQVEQTLVQTGIAAKTAAYLMEMFEGFNNGIVTGLEPRSEGNTTGTSMETFVKEVFAPAYSGIAVGA
ncbi:MAG TPA: NmrA family NAD(P)-binding protein [Candidatus Acidoferrum sp.]|nr:NmrA family NAD(P)-binding protein [Candidatus Acidoferrum sp.]